MRATRLPSDSSHLHVLANRAWRYVQANQPSRAALAYEELREYRPADARLLCNLSFLYESAGELHDAEDRARLAVRLAPRLGQGWNNLGVALREQHRWDEALAAFDRAATEQPDFALARFNYGTTALLAGNYRQGWSGYEQRFRLAECRAQAPNLPRWQGEPLAGRPLVVYSDQGAGDAIQFVRFLPEIRERAGGPLWLLVPRELQRLFANLGEVDRFVGEAVNCPADGVAVALGSLPNLLRLQLSQLPWREDYLCPPALIAPDLLQPLQAAADRTRIGLVWQGNPQQGRDALRSCPLRALRPLADIPDVAWFSLQVNDAGRNQLADVPDWAVTDLAPWLHDFADAAAAINELDLVITVDTAVAHLAGALGKPAWVLLSHTPDWRWGLAGADTPWYPSLRLFRQPSRGDWNSVVRSVGRAMGVPDASERPGHWRCHARIHG